MLPTLYYVVTAVRRTKHFDPKLLHVSNIIQKLTGGTNAPLNKFRCVKCLLPTPSYQVCLRDLTTFLWIKLSVLAKFWSPLFSGSRENQDLAG